jgi:F-type H+-transporting ATPase subunit delta
MSETNTVARPYAKAIFKHALDANQLAHWSIILRDMAMLIEQPDAKSFLSNPATTIDQKVQLLMIVCTSTNKDHSQSAENIVRALVENRRQLILPDIFAQYEALRAEQEKTLNVSVTSFATLTQEEQTSLIASLSKRLQRQVTLEINIDKSLLGGAIIQAGDLVIDGSVRGQLNKLSTNLAA